MTTHIGVNVYFWGNDEQRRLLVDGVRPWVLAARDQRICDAFWFCRFDARGPHVFMIFTPALGHREQLITFVRLNVSSFLRLAPSTVLLPPEELERRVFQCRGKTLCLADEAEGTAANNSFALFEHDSHRYPFWLSAGMAKPRELWRDLDRIALGSLQHLADGTHQIAAIRWIAAVDRSLERLSIPVAEYWRMHAMTLIPSLEQRCKTGEADVVALLPTVIGERNLRRFATVWRTSSGAGVDPEGVTASAVAVDGRSLQQRFRLLREINHTTLSQLGQPVKNHIPLILYAWHRRQTEYAASR